MNDVNEVVVEKAKETLRELSNGDLAVAIAQELVRRNFTFALYGYRHADEDRVENMYFASLPGFMGQFPPAIQLVWMAQQHKEHTSGETLEQVLDLRETIPGPVIVADGAENVAELGADGAA